MADKPLHASGCNSILLDVVANMDRKLLFTPKGKGACPCHESIAYVHAQLHHQVRMHANLHA